MKRENVLICNINSECFIKQDQALFGGAGSGNWLVQKVIRNKLGFVSMLMKRESDNTFHKLSYS